MSEKIGIGRLVGAEEALFLGVGLDELDLFVAAIGEAEIGESFRVDREKAHGGAIFGSHVGDGGAVGKREAGKSGAVKFDEFSDDAFLAQHLRDGEDEVGGRGAFGQAAVQLEADDRGNQHRERLAEHGGLRFDTANAPADDAEAVDHGGVRIGADERIGESDALAVLFFAEDDAREIFEIHLMADAGVRRDDLEILQGLLSPAQEGVALDVALHFETGVEGESVRGAEFVHLHGMVDDQLGGEQGIDFLRIAAELADGVAHGGEVDDGGHAGEILQQHARGHEGNFFFAVGGVPGSQGGNVVGVDEAVVFVAKQVFEKHFQRKRQARDIADAGFRERVQAIDFKGIIADAQRGAR